MSGALCRIPGGAAGVKWAPASIGKRDGVLWNYESIELFLGRGRECYQFILAPDNCLLDLFISQSPKKADKKWNSRKVKWSTVKKGLYWEGFLTVPLDELKYTVKDPENVFRFNAYRSSRFNMPGEPEKWEQCCYLPTFGGFRNLERFGTLTLE